MRDPIDREIEELERELREPLSGFVANPVSSDDTALLIRSLQSEFDLLKPEKDLFELTSNPNIHRPTLVKLFISQFASYTRMFWLASVFVFAMMTLMMSKINPYTYSASGDIFAIAMPLLLIAGIVYSYKSWNREMRLIESVSPFPPALLLLCRLLIVVGLNIVLGTVSAIYLNAASEHFPMLVFLVNWLSILLFLGGLLAVTMFWKGVRTGIAVSLFFWIVVNAVKTMPLFSRSVSATLMLELTLLVVGLLLLWVAYQRSLHLKMIQ